jgi:hypothetical protein
VHVHDYPKSQFNDLKSFKVNQPFLDTGTVALSNTQRQFSKVDGKSVQVSPLGSSCFKGESVVVQQIEPRLLDLPTPRKIPTLFLGIFHTYRT